MVFIFLSTIFWYLFFQSLGNTLLRSLHIVDDNPFLSVWIGFLFGAFLALFMALWLPLDNSVTRLTIGVAALPGISPTLHAWRTIFVGVGRRTLFLCGCCFCFLVLLQGAISCFGPMPYDTELYHQQTVLWLREYGLVPGLGNLHFRLAQISGWLALAAIVDWGPFQTRVAFIMPPLCLLSTLLYLFYGACRDRVLLKRAYLLSLLLLSCLYFSNFFTAYLFHSPGIFYDRPALILYCIFIAELLDVFLGKRTHNSLINKLKLISLIICASILFKPIGLPAVIFYIVVLFICLLTKKISYLDLLSIVWIPAAVGALWITINCILSGYPFFPLSFYHIPRDWSMQEQEVDVMRRAVQGFARWPRHGWSKALDSGLTYWFVPWLKQNLSNKIFLAGIVTPFFLGGALWLKAFIIRANLWKKLFFFSLALLQLVYWFFQHPNTRFGLELFWCWLALALVFSLPAKHVPYIHYSRNVLIILVLMVCITFAQGAHAVDLMYRDEDGFEWLLQPPSHGTYPLVQPYILHKGSPDEFTLYTSAPKHELCGNSPLPCAPSMKEDLFLQNPRDLGEGFIFRNIKK